MNPFGKLDDGTYLEQLDDRSFKFRLFIFNEDGKFMKLRKSAIEELVIEDDIFDMCHKGHLIFKNPHEILERSTKTHIEQVPTEVEPYRFRSDARDFILFELFPALDAMKPDRMNVEDFDNEFYSLKFTFCITEVEDLPSNSAAEKTKKLYFHDKRVQELLERDLYWNTGLASIRQRLVAHKKPLSKLTDAERGIYTGAGIRDILQQVFGEEVSISPDWDDGGRSIFYTSPAGSKAYDDLLELASLHVSSDDTDNQPCLLRLERHTNQWSLSPLSYYFDRSFDNASSTPGEYQNERFFISNEVDIDGSASNPPKSPTAKGNAVGNVTFPDLSMITGYVYNEMPGEDNQKYIVSTPIHTYHEVNKTFNFFHDKQSIENMFEFFETKMSSRMMGGTTGPYTDFFITKRKKENKNVHLKNSYYKDTLGPLIPSRNDVLKKALFNGASVEFQVRGSTNRRAARFISIDRRNPYQENDQDSKVLGQYFITGVKHIINQSGYFNTITGVKPYFYNKVDYNHEIE